MTRHRTLLVCLLLPLSLAGCAGMADSITAARGGVRPATEAGAPGADEWAQRWSAQAAPQDQEPEQDRMRKAAAAMVDGIRLYDNGDFEDAIARLSEPEIRSAPAPMRVEALKYIAFSHCVTQDLPDCRLAFDTALALDPDFALGRGEGCHPMWGPVFEQAKAASEQLRERAALAQARERLRTQDLWRPW